MKRVLIALAIVPLAGCAWMDEHFGDSTAGANSRASGTAAAIAPSKPLTAEQKRQGTDRLNEVTGMLIDANKLYGDAAKLAGDAEFKKELADLSAERGEQAILFQDQVRKLGGEPRTAGGVGGPWQEGLMNVKSIVQNDTQAAVDQVLAAENGLIQKLNDQLAAASLDEMTKNFIRSQRDSIMSDRDHVASLKSEIDARVTSQR